MKPLLLAILIIASLRPPITGAELSFDRVITSGQDYISNIYTCGSWQHDNKDGFYRIIHLDYYLGCSWLYVQWMKDFCCDGITKSYHTLSIYKNDHHENTFEKPTCTPTSDGIELSYVASNGHDNHLYNTKILVFHQFGQFKLIKKKNHTGN